MNRLLLLLAFAFFFVAGCDSSTNAPGTENKPKPTTAIIAGYVYNSDNGQALVGAKISIVGAGTTVTTGANGSFKFSGLVPGSYAFMINKNNVGIGKSDFITVVAGDSNYVPFGLHPVTGLWSMTIRWQGESAFFRSLQLDGDLRFTITGGSSPSFGSWSLTYDQILLSFPNGTQYSGTVAGSMAGTMLDYDGDTGNWTAIR